MIGGVLMTGKSNPGTALTVCNWLIDMRERGRRRLIGCFRLIDRMERGRRRRMIRCIMQEALMLW